MTEKYGNVGIAKDIPKEVENGDGKERSSERGLLVGSREE